MDREESVCAVVVTYNRKELLLECIAALLDQTAPLSAIYIIDNTSTDGTPAALKEKKYIKEVLVVGDKPEEAECTVNVNKRDVRIYYVRMSKNTGGAGGFYEGIQRAYGRGYDWLWLLDDDTISKPDALQQLISAHHLVNDKNTSIFTSKVLWVDGNEHRMNIPSFNFKIAGYSRYLDQGLLPIRAASFVSLLLKSEYVKTFGLPLKEYFMWNDDSEYTGRILKNTNGYMVNNSIVIHKTKMNYIAWESVGERFYYEVRNKLWVIKGDSFFPYEKMKILAALFNNICGFLSKNGLRGMGVVTRGMMDGIFRRAPHAKV